MVTPAGRGDAQGGATAPKIEKRDCGAAALGENAHGPCECFAGMSFARKWR